MGAFEEILTQREISTFDSPPDYNDKQLEALFRFPDEAEVHIKSLRAAKSKLAFIMQFAYCQATSQFISPSEYKNNHILKAIRLRSSLRELSYIKTKKQLNELKSELSGVLLSRHRKTILKILKINEINKPQLEELDLFVAEQAKKQMGPEALLHLLVGEIHRRRWLVPSISKLTNLVSKNYASEEKLLLDIINETLGEDDKNKLLSLLEENGKGFCQLQYVKNINQSVAPRVLQQNAKTLLSFLEIHRSCGRTLRQLDLNEQAVAYYSRWVFSSDSSDIKKIKDPNRILLYLLGFVTQQVYDRQDAAVDGFMKKLTNYLNRARKDSEQKRVKQSNQQVKALEAVAKSKSDFVSEIKSLITVGEDTSINVSLRLTKVLTGLIDLVGEEDKQVNSKSSEVNSLIESAKTKSLFYESLLSNSDAIISALSGTLKALVFDKQSSNANLYKAIEAFQKGKQIPTSYLNSNQRKLLNLIPEKQHVLNKLFLFEAARDGFKSGALNLLYGFVWVPFDRLQKGGHDWKSELPGWLKTYNLTDYQYFEKYKKKQIEIQDELLAHVNGNYDSGLNPHVIITDRSKVKLKPHRADANQNQPNTISELLFEVDKLSVKDLLLTIQSEYNFMDSFVHARNKHVNRDVDENLILASTIALGCNIGPRNMIKCSEGISESELLTTVEHRMTPDNLRRANDYLNRAINRLPLSDVFQFDSDVLHSSSDGQKITVDGESLMSSPSFKYFGSGSGIARYPYVDERNRMRETLAFSSAIRESTYVLDALVGNVGKISQMHSTDSHGYSNAVFGVSNILGIKFAPRLKGIEKTGLYSTRPVSHWKKYGYAIRPTSNINWSLIESHWDEILRIVITIMSGKASASQLFRRLNSYSKNSLYKALKEVGQISKTNFVLEYIDNLELRKRIQKQLNVGEHANSFFKAVFWGRGHRLHINKPGDEERYFLSAQLIQSAVVLWNYLYVSKALDKIKSKEEVDLLLESLKQGQMLAWRHVNFSGEFDFRKSSSVMSFDVARLEKIIL